MAVFRFLVNVDNCLDTTHYNCFFYKLKSRGSNGQGLFHLSDAQLLEGDPLSLRGAISDIRMYLDKYPYEVEDYRIILLMRTPYNITTQKWESSLLYRLLRLRYEFLKSNILLSTAVEAERDNALNFVMLYDSNFSADLPTLKPYFSSERLSEDVALLLQNYGIDPQNGSAEELMNRLSATLINTENKDTTFSAENFRSPHEADFLHRFYLTNKKEEKLLEGQDSIVTLVTAFAKELLFNYRVYERFINCSDRRDETLSFLRITDFINHDTTPAVSVGGHTPVSTLAQRCDDAWNEVWNNADAKIRFASMLASYSARLQKAERDLAHPTFAVDADTDLPTKTEPSTTDINSKTTSFSEGSEERKRQDDVLKKLTDYSKKKLFRKSFREDWNNTYNEIIETLNELKDSLRVYAQDLSHQYAEILSKRKKETVDWKSGKYAAFPSEQENLENIEKNRSKILNHLKKPHMNPSISFQDVLNSERAVNQASKNISFYLDCLRETRLINFLLILAICAGFFILHYTILQPYNFSALNTLMYYFIYIGGATVLMGTVVWLPYRYYCKCVQKSISELKDELEVYIKGYYDHAQYFYEYINHINCLDYLTRYRDLLYYALKRGNSLIAGQLWHRDQIAKHREMLNYFSGLIESAPPCANNEDVSVVSVISHGQVRDVADCPIYWPQA